MILMNPVRYPLIRSYTLSYHISSEQIPPKAPGIISDTVDENGIRTIVEYTINDEGKKVKVCCCSCGVTFLVIIFP